MSPNQFRELCAGLDHITVEPSVNRMPSMNSFLSGPDGASTAADGLMVPPEGTACQCDRAQTRLSLLIDEVLELEIQVAGKNVEIYNLRMGEPGCSYFYLAAMRDQWVEVMRDRILARSPDQIARMEAAMGVIQA